MIIEIDGQICSTEVTHCDSRSWRGVVERREKSATGEGKVLFRANVEVFSLDDLLRRDKILRQRDQEKTKKVAREIG